MRSKFFKIIECFIKVREINTDFVKGNKFFFFYYILKCVKILFLFLYIDQIYVLYEKIIWAFPLFMKNENCED